MPGHSPDGRRGAQIRRGLAPVIAAALLLGVVVAVPAAADETADATGASAGAPPYPNEAAFQQALATSQAPAPSPGAAEPGPAEQESRTAYQDQSAAEALETGRSEHPEVILTPAWEPFTLAPDSQVESYVGDYAARVDVPSASSDVLVESALPLRAGSAPVDLALAPRGSAYEPANPLVPARISTDLSGGVSLPDINVGLTPLDTQGTPAGHQVEDKLFYANAYPDSDIVVRPLPTGVETSIQLRSVDSPESFAVKVDLPEGTHLEAGGPGWGAAIVGDGEVIARVAEPIAWDADHRPIPATIQVQGDRLVLGIDHRSGSWRYPLMLDPTLLEEQRYWVSSPGVDTAGWQPIQSSTSNGIYPQYGDWGLDGFQMGRGLYTWLYSGAYYDSGQWSGWTFDSPGTQSFVWGVEFGQVTVQNQSAGDGKAGVATTEGIWNPGSGQWASGVTSNLGPSPAVVQWLYQQDTLHCMTGDCQVQGTLDNQARLITYTYSPGYTGSWVNASFLGGAAVWLADQIPPEQSVVEHRVNGVPGTPPTTWVDGTNLSVVTQARDRGFGVQQFKLSVPGKPADFVRTFGCSGDRTDRCPSDAGFHRSDEDGVTGPEFHYTTRDSDGPGGPDQAMPDGWDTVRATALDALGNVAANTWQLKVDHSKPSLQLSGSLYEQRNENPLKPGVYRLKPAATDLYSGVQDISIEVDGRNEFSRSNTCQTTGCPNQLDGDYQFVTATQTPGVHHVVVRATDQLGHITTEEFDVRVDYTPDCPGAFVDHSATNDPVSLGGCPDPASSRTFEGTCSVSGTFSRDYESSGFLGSGETEAEANGSGTCSGTLGGQAVTNSPVTLSLSDYWTCALVNVPSVEWAGPASLIFTNGTSTAADDTAISLTYTLDGADTHALRLRGADGGDAIGDLSMNSSWGGCSDASDVFSADFRTLSALRDDG